MTTSRLYASATEDGIIIVVQPVSTTSDVGVDVLLVNDGLGSGGLCSWIARANCRVVEENIESVEGEV